ncbi:MAG TPA: DegT/DnrJ/EryC1/StrS family aminotransferase, partial [Magnetospirillum sp.]|nr:DegT/DnrJ/EryC1/StrS family aminotransferase [Magnetospirillum sp.]
YQAAVALAALDGWPATRAEFVRVLCALRDALAGVDGIVWPQGLGDGYAASTACVGTRLPAPELAAQLASRGIETRRWWQDGLHGHDAFAACPRTALPVTDHLAAHTLGLPCWQGMRAADVTRIARALRQCADPF